MISRNVSREFAPVVVVLMLAVTASFAKESRSVKISRQVILNQVVVAPGEYKVIWETHLPEAAVALARDDKVVATATARLVERDKKYDTDMLVYSKDVGGSQTIVEIRFGGTRQALVFGE